MNRTPTTLPAESTALGLVVIHDGELATLRSGALTPEGARAKARELNVRGQRERAARDATRQRELDELIAENQRLSAMKPAASVRTPTSSSAKPDPHGWRESFARVRTTGPIQA